MTLWIMGLNKEKIWSNKIFIYERESLKWIRTQMSLKDERYYLELLK